MPMLQNAISQTAESHLGMNNVKSGIIYHKQLYVVFIQLHSWQKRLLHPRIMFFFVIISISSVRKV